MKTGSPLHPDSRHLAKGQQRNTAGFTLIELMATVLIAAILAAIAAPSFSTIVANRRTKAAASDLYVAVAIARSEALKRNVDVKLTPKTGGWPTGWQIWPTRDSSGAACLPSITTCVIVNHAAVSGAAIVGPTDLTYQTSGRLKVTGGTAPSFDISNSGAPTAHWCVTVDPSGRPYIKSSSC